MLPHLEAAHNLARWLLGSAQDAEDAVQDSYVRALTYFDSFHGQDGRAWLLTIVRNSCYAWLRKNRSGLESTDVGVQLELTPDTAPDPEAVHLRELDRRKIQKCLESLPAEFREVLVLREMEELTYRQIAQITAVPIGTVMSRLARGRRRLQQMLTIGIGKEAQ
jgi:RNA polymerase sigma-70 factor, ECF subfamily